MASSANIVSDITMKIDIFRPDDGSATIVQGSGTYNFIVRNSQDTNDWANGKQINTNTVVFLTGSSAFGYGLMISSVGLITGNMRSLTLRAETGFHTFDRGLCKMLLVGRRAEVDGFGETGVIYTNLRRFESDTEAVNTFAYRCMDITNVWNGITGETSTDAAFLVFDNSPISLTASSFLNSPHPSEVADVIQRSQKVKNGKTFINVGDPSVFNPVEVSVDAEDSK